MDNEPSRNDLEQKIRAIVTEARSNEESSSLQPTAGVIRIDGATEVHLNRTGNSAQGVKSFRPDVLGATP